LAVKRAADDGSFQTPRQVLKAVQLAENLTLING
jgi:hypothetical protein